MNTKVILCNNEENIKIKCTCWQPILVVKSDETCIKYTNQPDNPEGGGKGVQAMTNDLYPCICIEYNSEWMKKMERGKGTYFLKDYCNNLHEI